MWPLSSVHLRGWAEIRSPIGECRTDFQSVLQNVQVISARALMHPAVQATLHPCSLPETASQRAVHHIGGTLLSIMDDESNLSVCTGCAQAAHPKTNRIANEHVVKKRHVAHRQRPATVCSSVACFVTHSLDFHWEKHSVLFDRFV